MTESTDLQMGVIAFQHQDYETAFILLHPIACSGNAEAQCILGNIYQLGLGVTPDLEEAARWYQRLSDQGYGVATNNLAGMLGSGYANNAPDPEAATHLYEKARSQGFSHAPRKYPY